MAEIHRIFNTDEEDFIGVTEIEVLQAVDNLYEPEANEVAKKIIQDYNIEKSCSECNRYTEDFMIVFDEVHEIIRDLHEKNEVNKAGSAMSTSATVTITGEGKKRLAGL